MINQGRFNRRAAALAAALLVGGAGLPARADDAIAPDPVRLPEDEGVHADASFEWWYYTGHLTTASGRELGLEHVFFRASRDGFLGWAAHCALTDKDAREFAYDQRLIVGDGPNGGTAESMNYVIDDWRIQGASDRGRIVGSAGGAEWRLIVEARKPVVLHGGDGYAAVREDLASYYYSRTRCSVSGTLVADGVEEAVTGEAWMDHQWGKALTFLEGGWDWFGLQFEDGRELMAYAIRERDGTPIGSAGTWVEADGTSHEVLPGGVELISGEEWTSPATGATYPINWTIRIPELEADLRATAVMPEQELDTRPTTRVIYWEGAMTLEGVVAGQPIRGRGYVELTGYAGPPTPPVD